MGALRSFFDPSLVESAGAAFIREDKVESALRRLMPKAHISKGSFTFRGRSELRDLAWNHMDQNHRPFIHRTYDDAARFYIGHKASFALTRRGPFVIPVFDGYYKENGFYQVMTLFGLVVVICVIECNGNEPDTRMDIGWMIASHPWLRFLHGPLNRRLLQLNDVQNKEDVEIRERRVALRAAGYRFTTDDPDFITANVRGNNVVFPVLAGTQTIPIGNILSADPVRIEVGDRAFVIRRREGVLDVWPGICLHEGAELCAKHVGAGTIKCPWHGLEFGARRLEAGGGDVVLCGARLRLEGAELLVSPA